MREELIKKMAQELKPFAAVELLPSFLMKRLVPIFVLFSVMILLMINYNQVLADRWDHWDFHAQNLVWAFVALGSFIAFYNSTFPEKRARLTEGAVGIGVAVLLGIEIYRIDYLHFGHDFHLEMNVFRGGCGIIISLMSMGYWYLLQQFAAKGAPRSLERAGLWASLSASAVGCFLMQAVCFQEGSLHLILWHFLPLMLSCYFGPIAARKWMKW